MAQTRASISLKFGILGGPLEAQLAAQGIRIPSTEVFEKVRNSIIMLSLHDYIDDEAKERMFQQLINEISEAVDFSGSEVH